MVAMFAAAADGRMVRCWGGLRWGGEEGEEAGGYGFTIVE